MPIDYAPKLESKIQKFSNKYNTGRRKTAIISPVVTGYNPRETKMYPSRVTQGGDTSLKTTHQYTGTEMLGVTILHKSCLQPVFNQQAAKDAASMRR